jgi:hypothetical protein
MDQTSQSFKEVKRGILKDMTNRMRDEEVCNSDIDHTETSRDACCDANESSNTGHCVVATECRDVEGEDVNNGASCMHTDVSDRSHSYIQAGGHGDSMSVCEEPSVLGNTAEGQQSETAAKTRNHHRTRGHMEPTVNPRPLNCTRVVTRQQFQKLRRTEGKISLDVKDILSSRVELLRPEFRTRSMKVMLEKMKHVLQYLTSYPVVVLDRIDD